VELITTAHNGPSGVAAERLNEAECQSNFCEMHTPLEENAARVEAERCYFCFDAPCTEACPTGIDIPGFIRMIANGNAVGAAGLILEENIMGGTCARACPVETLCEGVCVRNHGDDRPVTIGLLQRFAVDEALEEGTRFFSRCEQTGKSIGVVGAGPASLSCAHRLAVLGHDVVVYEARSKSGGLNEYGLAAYKMLDEFAQKEAEFITSLGGIEIVHDTILGKDVSLEKLQERHDALFLGIGLGGCNTLGIPGEDAEGVADAVAFIDRLRQAGKLSAVPVGRRVIVIGGGMTAIDAAVQAKLLGAEEVTIAYRRGADAMKASIVEQEFAKIRGVSIRYWAQPSAVMIEEGRAVAVEFQAGADAADGEKLVIPADMVLKAIGQGSHLERAGPADSFEVANGRLVVDEECRTSCSGIWAGGDCIAGGDDLTVSAVQDGKVAANSIHRALLL
jgi:dihydropyrimidine dehydrogenase (NAD+) subunit PreT